MTNILKFLAKILAVPLMGLLAYAGVMPTQNFSGTNNNASVSAVFETSLAAPIAAADVTMTLASNVIDTAGDTLPNAYTCFTVDQGQPNNEFICGTVSGTSVTGMIRGVSPITGTTTVASLGQQHRRGADVKITDWPTLGILNNQMNGLESIPNPLSYAQNETFSSSTQIVDKNYVDTTAISGAPNSSETVNGIAQLATAAQAGAGTSAGSTGARLILPNSLTAEGCTVSQFGVLVASSTNGKLDGNCLNTNYSYTYTATSTYSAGLIIATTTITSANIASTSIATLNAKNINYSGTLSGVITIPHYSEAGTFGAPSINNSGTGANLYATSSVSMVIPAGIMTASSTIDIIGDGTCTVTSGTVGCSVFIKDSTGNTLTTVGLPTASTNTDFFTMKVFNNSSLSSQNYIAETPTGGGTGTANINTANSVTLFVVVAASANVGGGSNGTMTLNHIGIIVNP